MKRRTKDGDEVEVVLARRVYAWTDRAGATARVKRRMRRRERHEARRDLRNGAECG